MPIEQSQPVRFTPRGLADAFDATDVFAGACRKLTNLVFDQSNPEIVIPRPGVLALTSFAGFTTPGFVSLHVTIGQYVYGMVATGLTAGKDQPFCYDLKAGAFITVSGCTAGNAENRPTSPATSGDWVPPTLAVIGAKVIITHPGYSGAAGVFFGVIDVSNPAAPSYTTANTATNLLPTVPTGVANLNNRAYFICGNRIYYSDVLVPTNMAGAGQSLTLGDPSVILALSGLPVTTSSGGVISALLAFKGTQIWQINGDAASTSNPIQLNYLSLNIGCASPRTITPTPSGTFFVGPDACYKIDYNGLVEVVANGDAGTPDIRQPFGYITTPTRASASFAGNIYRVCVQTIIDGVAGTFDYWFDKRKQRWNGPHTFTYDCASSVGTYFILSSAASPAKLFSSAGFPSTSSLYTDDGTVYNIDMLSATYPKTDEMAMKQMVESTIELSSVGVGASYGITASDDKGNYLSSTNVQSDQVGTVWGSNTWGDGSRWQTGSLSRPRTYSLAWPFPLVFNKFALEVSSPAAKGQSIGTFYGRFQKLNYTLNG